MNVIGYWTSGRKVALLGVIAAGLAWFGGYNMGRDLSRPEIDSAREETRRESAADRERDAKILAVIVRKNPGATIRDFSDFPAALVEESQRRGLDYRYVMAIIEKESEWNPRAVSHAGAVGLMQVMPATGALVAKNLGRPFSPPKGKDDLGTLGDPRANLVLGLSHLKGLIDSYGLGPVHLRAYNRGGAAARAHWPADRYAEDVALKFVRLSMLVPRS